MILLDVATNTVVEVADTVANDSVMTTTAVETKDLFKKDLTKEGITGYTGLVTVLGFSLVVVLLAAFVYVMKLLGWIMQPRVKAKKVENVAAEQTVTHTKSKITDSITLTADSTAAIALALHLYYNGVHDEEDTKITIQPHRTQWNNKMYGMNNLHR